MKPDKGLRAMNDSRRWSAGTALLLLALVMPGFAWAQTAPPVQPQQNRPPAKSPPAKAPAKDGARPADGQSESQLRQKVEHLEEQIADMQITIGTLESLARGGSAGPVSAAARQSSTSGGGVEQARIDSLETQIRALTGQVEQLADQLRQSPPGRRSDFDRPPPISDPGSREQRNAGGVTLPPARGEGFGSTTVTPVERDPIGRILGTTEGPQPVSASPGGPGSGGGNPRELYETAYGYLLQQDYGASEASFEEFLRRYPNDRLTADAQYWYGETLYVQKRFKQAGQAFLTVVEKHKSSAKVPNSLLKLAQSLDQLGQKDCGIFNELETRHANAPADVRTRARALKQRQGC